MNSLVQAASVLAAFAAAHERLIELIRTCNDRLSVAYRTWQPLGAWIDRNTSGSGNTVVAVGLAFATKANLLALFYASKVNPQQAWFFDLFMGTNVLSNDHGLSALAMVVGYVLMGFSTALGAKTLHDLASGLVDVRQRLQGIATEPTSPGTTVQPSTQVVVPPSSAKTLTPVVAPSGPGPSAGPPPGASVGT